MTQRARDRSLHTRATLTLPAAIALLLTACGSRSTTAPTAPSTTVAAAFPTDGGPDSSAVISVPTSGESPTTEHDGESDIVCGTLAPLISTARVISSTSVDWSGTGTADATATVYETAPDTSDYRLRVERDGRGSEMAVIMSAAGVPDAGAAPTTDTGADSGAPVGGDPAVIAAVQVDGTGTPNPQMPNPQELLVRVATVASTGSGARESSSGYDLAVFFNDLEQGTGGCIGRFKGADGLELVLPIRAGGWAGSPKSGLACDNNPVSSSVTDYLVRTTAQRVAGKNTVFTTHDIVLIRGAAAGAPAGSSADQLLDGEDTPGRVVDYGGPTGPLLRYSTLSGCGLDAGDIADQPNEGGTVDTVDEGLAD